MNINEVCCKLKIDKNTNPLSNQPFLPKENKIKENMILKCNDKLINNPSPTKKQLKLKSPIPIGNVINLRSKNKNLKKVVSLSISPIDLTNNKKRSPTPSPKVKKLMKKPTSPKVKKLMKKPTSPKVTKNTKNIENLTYTEIKKMYKSKIDKKIDSNLFLKFKKKYKITTSKYLSNLTKDEYIKLINFLNI